MNDPAKKVALITGANKGIGLEISRQLGKLGFAIILGSRDKKRGLAATEELKSQGIDAHALIIDVTHGPSIIRAVDFLQQGYGHLDVLVNNAGAIHDRTLKPSEIPLDTVRETFEPNFFGVIAITQALVPLLLKSEAGRVVNMSSSLGSLTTLSDPQSFDGGWRLLGYGASKTALNAFTVHLAHELRNTPVKVNSAHPGWIKTDMGGEEAPGTVAEGADTPVWLATLPPDGPTGGFFYERKPHAW